MMEAYSLALAINGGISKSCKLSKWREGWDGSQARNITKAR